MEMFEVDSQLDPSPQTQESNAPAYWYFQQAEAHYLAGQDELAQDAYLKALALAREGDQFLFETYKNLGNIFVRAGDFDAAEENYNRAYTLNPRSDALIVNYGILEIQRDNMQLAIERFREAVCLNRFNDKAWVGLALVHRKLGDHELAWANLVHAIDLNGDNQTARHLADQWARADGQPDENTRFNWRIR